MSKDLVAGIDIGTYHVKVVIARRDEDGSPVVIGSGIAESKGVRHGYITHPHEISEGITHAWKSACEQAGERPKHVFIGIGGIGLGSIVISSTTIISRADSEITNLDIENLHNQCEKDIPAAATQNRKIIHSVPLQYKIDGKVILGSPIGMKSTKLEVKMLFITCLEHHINDVMDAVQSAGIRVTDVMASPIAASLVTLTQPQKIAGCVLANIGAETVSIAVFENSIPVSLEVFPIGSTDITNDIALGLKVPLEDAEHIKIGELTGSSIPRKKLDEIVSARLSDIFDLIEAHLKKIGRSGLLPAGIIITGGGSHITSIEDMAKAALRLPSRKGSIIVNPGDKSQFKDSSWAVAYGLCVFGYHADDRGGSVSNGHRIITQTKNNLFSWIKQFLP